VWRLIKVKGRRNRGNFEQRTLFPMTDFDQCRRNMVENQLRPNKVTDRRVLAAMGAVPRERFIDEAHRGIAYVDEDIPLGDGRCLIEPMVLARLLQSAEIGPDDVVLDIGCGSGYTAAVCAKIAATVVAVESDPRLAAQATGLMEELEIDNVVVVEAPLATGYARQAPYDVIIFSGAVPDLPEEVLGQLAEGGRLVAVTAEESTLGQAVLARECGGVVSRRVLFDASVPILPGCAKAPGFVF
jgi:protein-L-isoaspartate(D-aspartate) O-methyltransferase